MKIILLLFSNIRGMFKESRSVALVIVIGIAFSCFGIVFYSGYFMYNFDATNWQCEVTVYADKNINDDKMSKLIDALCNDGEKGAIRLVVSQNAEYYKNVDIVGLYERNYDQFLLCGSGFIPQENEADAIVSEMSVSMLGYDHNIIGEKINVQGYELTVKGLHKFQNGCCVPIKYYLNYFHVNNIKAEYDTRISAKLEKLLNESNCTYDIQYNDNPFMSIEFIIPFIQVVMIFCISFINVLLMFSFWRVKMQQTFRVYYICGCNKFKKFLLIMLQVLFFELLGLIVGGVLFILLFNKFSSLTLIYSGNNTYYLFVLLFVLIMLIIFAIIFALKSSCKKQNIRIIKE